MYSIILVFIKRLFMSLAALLLLATLLFIAGNLWVVASTARYIDSHLEECRPNNLAIVFGTSHWTRSGLRNPHFYARMRTSARLIEEQRVSHLLLSGDNRTQAYNEPRAMWRELYRRGVPASQMTMDFAGFSTYDTLVRSRDVFQLNEALLVTQSWHLPRAIFIARALGMEVTGCVAEEERVAGEWRLIVREWVARVATLGDLYIWGREPYFLGPPEPIELHRADDKPGADTYEDSRSEHGQLERSQSERSQPERSQPERSQPERSQPERSQPERSQPKNSSERADATADLIRRYYPPIIGGR